MVYTENIDKNTLEEFFKDERNVEITILTQDEFIKKHPLFKDIFTRSINRWKNQTVFYNRKSLNGDGYDYDYINMYSDKHEYRISFLNDEYIGCCMHNRYTHAFETHHRGMDLTDGDYSVETMCSILADIVSYEVVKVDIKDDCYQYNNIEYLKKIVIFKCPHCGWEIKIDEFQIDKLEEFQPKIECGQCNKEVRITTDNVTPLIS